MTEKRLEEIKERYEKRKEFTTPLSYMDCKWLIEQAELVPVVERQRDRYRSKLHEANEDQDDCHLENLNLRLRKGRYRDLLKKIENNIGITDAENDRLLEEIREVLRGDSYD